MHTQELLVTPQNKKQKNIFQVDKPKITFKDVIGLEGAKQELTHFIRYLQNPSIYKKIGAHIPYCLLLSGAPGNGKTLLTRAMAGEAKCTFLYIRGSQFIKKIGDFGSRSIHALFCEAHRNAPAIIFLDEIDACEATTTLALLKEIEHLKTLDKPVLVIAATNQINRLHPIVMHSEHFTQHINFTNPDAQSRHQILQIQAQKIPVEKDVNLQVFAGATNGFSRQEIINLLNEAGINAAADGRTAVTQNDLDETLDKMLLGRHSDTIKQSSEDLERTAYHEAGHALMALVQPASIQTVRKITISSRGRVLGVTYALLRCERDSHSREELMANIVSSLGGRVAEELIFNQQFSSAYDDLQQANRIAKRMVCVYGMSSLGLISCGPNESTMAMDNEAQKFVNEAYEIARNPMAENLDLLHHLAQELLKKKTLSADEIEKICKLHPRTQPTRAAE